MIKQEKYRVRWDPGDQLIGSAVGKEVHVSIILLSQCGVVVISSKGGEEVGEGIVDWFLGEYSEERTVRIMDKNCSKGL